MCGSSLTCAFVPFAQEAISKDVETNREAGNGDEVEVGMPCCELHCIVRASNNGRSDELS